MILDFYSRNEVTPTSRHSFFPSNLLFLSLALDSPIKERFNICLDQFFFSVDRLTNQRCLQQNQSRSFTCYGLISCWTWVSMAKSKFTIGCWNGRDVHHSTYELIIVLRNSPYPSYLIVVLRHLNWLNDFTILPRCIENCFFILDLSLLIT